VIGVWDDDGEWGLRYDVWNWPKWNCDWDDWVRVVDRNIPDNVGSKNDLLLCGTKISD